MVGARGIAAEAQGGGQGRASQPAMAKLPGLRRRPLPPQLCWTAASASGAWRRGPRALPCPAD